ncbi:MAG: DUF1611 domain-containing protein, partial [Candidatus Competibacteraceae bacterium]|nr:DUF1611 domain-containing protein [Candidatus Competibacteraceae bacterium]
MTPTSMPADAVLLTCGLFRTPNAKVAHGLVRGGERFRVRAVVDPVDAGCDAGQLLDGHRRDIPVVSNLTAALEYRPRYAVVGIATPGGRLTPQLRALLLEALEQGLSVVNGLHDFTQDDPGLVEMARFKGVELIDVRRPRPRSELRFWEGEALKVRAARIAVLGTDCAIGKRTTARLLTEALNGAGIRAEMIYTGQTGWMQG